MQRIIKILEDTLKLWPESFDVLAGMTTHAGAFGTVPLAACLSLKMKKRLVVLAEMEFGEYYIAPLSLDRAEHLKSKRVVLLKDVLARGRGLQRAGARVAESGGVVSGVVVLIDLGLIPDFHLPGATPSATMNRIISEHQIDNMEEE